ncbi:aminotransferase class I/II-fold pyridoxal phosphate-dependent enzyme [Streptomyces sp. ET3-23]|uniref:aminotransferase class I/II-fold pyridoxal phosphate-dependent enzyme n=1 Tax=Streptomyces sp. ET3-23 TaxID=2885643 RepID=UPI001D116D35|nr:aminotransferase class I/II-fold pyridoxal phosphate-dependent enzyme [Streptomyces sp. ET3-23]MCC2274797.1 aminotransferase class I/II-fold pyridoxal phosphate-dependent enzyme [Streptomyces sp. ET3-23]
MERTSVAAGPTQMPALLGGTPALAEPARVGRPNAVGRARFLERLNGALDRGVLSNGGPLVREFEQRVAELAGVRHAVATCNATAALQLAVRATDLTGEVVVPAFTFPATAHAVSWTGLTPVFCDVDPRTGTLDLGHAESLIGPRTSAILGVHTFGRPHGLDALQQLADGYGLRLLFDAAHALGCTIGGRAIGGFGDAEVFSFHATKFVHAFEGGALVTDDPQLARRAAAMANFGYDEDGRPEHLGTNAKMSEAAAAMGLTSLDHLEEFRAHNRTLHERYTAGLAGLPGVTVLPFDERERNNYQYAVLHIDAAALGLTRDELDVALRADNVVTRRYFHPGLHQAAPYRGGPRLPHTESLADRCLVLPTGTATSAADAERIAFAVRRVAGHAAAVAGALRAVPAAA